eukprot:3988748-Prymnesium_polylepis.1
MERVKAEPLLKSMEGLDMIMKPFTDAAFGLAAVKSRRGSGNMYVVGGAAGEGSYDESFSSVEMYDPNRGVWTALPAMIESRWAPCAVWPSASICSYAVGKTQIDLIMPAWKCSTRHAAPGSWRSRRRPLASLKEQVELVLALTGVAFSSIVDVGLDNASRPVQASRSTSASIGSISLSLPPPGRRLQLAHPADRQPSEGGHRGPDTASVRRVRQRERQPRQPRPRRPSHGP